MILFLNAVNESRVTWDVQQKHFFCQILNDRIYPEIFRVEASKEFQVLVGAGVNSSSSVAAMTLAMDMDGQKEKKKDIFLSNWKYLKGRQFFLWKKKFCGDFQSQIVVALLSVVCIK